MAPGTTFIRHGETLTEVVLLPVPIALKVIEDTLYQVNKKWISTSILNKTQVAHQVDPVFCPFTFKIINHVKADFQNFVVTKERETMAELKPFAMVIPVSGNPTKEWAVL